MLSSLEVFKPALIFKIELVPLAETV